VPLLRDAPARVGRLLEMDADELAADHHEPRVLASALVAVTSAGTSAPPGGRIRTAHTRGLAGSDAAARVRRLLSPPARLPRRHRTLTGAAVVALTVAPVLLAAAPVLIALH
jgi:hypothetical protein